MILEDKIRLRITFAHRVASARKQAGISQPQLARLAGVSRAQIVNIEQGRTGVGLEALVEISRATKKSTDWLLGLK